MNSTYEGWPNFETWCVHEAVSEPGNARYWRGVARWQASEAKARHAERETCREARHDAAIALAREISKGLYDEHPLPMNDVYADLLSAALDAVDYVAIAEGFLHEFFDQAGPATNAPDTSDGLMTFETYTVLTWATTDAHTAAHWQKTAQECLEAARWRPAPRGAVSATSAMLAEALRDQLPEMVARGTSGVRDALVDCALSRIHWRRLARRLIDNYGLYGAGGPGAEPGE